VANRNKDNAKSIGYKRASGATKLSFEPIELQKTENLLAACRFITAK